MTKCIIKPLLLVCIMVLSVAVRAAADNTVSIGTVAGKPGDTVELQIGLANTNNVSSVQVSIPIDARLALVENSAKATDRTSGHNVTAGVKDGKLNLFVYSLSMGDIAPGEGTIATVRLKLGNEPSDLVLSADKVVLTDHNGSALPHATATDGRATISCAKAEYSSRLIEYGRVPIRSSYQQTVSVSNVGNAPLVVSGVEFSAAEFSCAESFPAEIAAGSSKVFTLTYAPMERGGITEEAKFITNSVYKLNTVKLKALPFAVNELHVENVSGVADSTVTVSLRMNNMDAITGFQFDFNLPEQLEYVNGSFTLSGRKADHQLTASMKGRTLRALAFSLSDTPFSGNDGEIATFKVKLNGRYGTSLEAQKAMLTANIKGKETDVLSDKYAGYVNILSPRMSTTDGISMGRTPITQEAKATFRINNYGSAPLRIERVVVSSDHMKVDSQLPIVIDSRKSTDVDVVWDGVAEGDYNELLQLYTNDPDQRLHNIKVTGNRYSPNYLTLSSADVEPGDTMKLHIALSNNDIVNGLQFDLKYDKKCFELLDKNVWSERANGYSMTTRDMDNGQVRCFCYSLGGNEIAQGEGNVMTVLFAVKKDATIGSYAFKVGNVLLSTPGLVNKYSGAGNDVTIKVVKPVRTITISKSEHGTVKGGGSYDLGATATLTAVPDEGYHFVSWSDGNTDNPRTISVNANITLSAVFAPNSYTLKYVVDGKDYKTYTLEFGTKITPEENPTKEGYTFSGWSDIPETMPAHDVTVEGKFNINSYTLKYVVDGEEYKTYTLEFGTAITPEEAPTKEAYTFSGWSDIPETMPAHDVTVEGKFNINSYTLKYVVDGEEYKTYTLEFGTAITPEDAPTKEGYSFSGWSDIPETMPAHDVTVEGKFNINSYTLKYVVDGEEYKTYTLEFGTAITPEEAPTKEGYTFSGWSEIPETMPAHDVTVEGKFNANSYTLKYVVDGEAYKTYTLEFGTKITPEDAPTKEGYSFSGWSDIPETMPAHDVTVEGKFNINSYTLKYVVDGEDYKTYTLEFGTAITPEDAPTKEGYTFSGWSEIPKTMPAHDVTVEGKFNINSYTLKYVVDGEEYKTYTLEFGTAITPEEAPTKEGYTFSGWSDIPETMPAHDVTVEGTFKVHVHKVTWKLDGEFFTETEVEYGGIIAAPDVPEKEGYEFVGWEDIPETMPDQDITINGTYTPVSAIARIMADHQSAKVYTMQGTLVGNSMTLSEIMKLPDGIYIINGKKVVKQ